VVCVLACLRGGAPAVPGVDVVGIVMELALRFLLAPDEALDLDPITDAVCLDAVKERQLLRPETHTCTSTHTQKPSALSRGLDMSRRAAEFACWGWGLC
jgi:hypothetical protein